MPLNLRFFAKPRDLPHYVFCGAIPMDLFIRTIHLRKRYILYVEGERKEAVQKINDVFASRNKAFKVTRGFIVNPNTHSNYMTFYVLGV